MDFDSCNVLSICLLDTICCPVIGLPAWLVKTFRSAKCAGSALSFTLLSRLLAKVSLANQEGSLSIACECCWILSETVCLTSVQCACESSGVAESANQWVLFSQSWNCCVAGKVKCKSRSALRGNELQASVRRLGRKDKSKPKTRSNQDNNINNNSACFIWLSRTKITINCFQKCYRQQIERWLQLRFTGSSSLLLAGQNQFPKPSCNQSVFFL